MRFFEPNVMLFGLQGAPGTFSRMIVVDMAPMYREFPENRFKHYMDDCLVATGEVLRMDSWYVSECFVVSGLPTVRIWNRANAGCHSWNPLTCLLSRFVPLTEG